MKKYLPKPLLKTFKTISQVFVLSKGEILNIRTSKLSERVETENKVVLCFPTPVS